MSQPIYHEENVKADTTDWDSAATLAALSATTNHQNTAGLLAELNSSAGEWQPSMSTGVAGDAYSNLRIKFVDQVCAELLCASLLLVVMALHVARPRPPLEHSPKYPP